MSKWNWKWNAASEVYEIHDEAIGYIGSFMHANIARQIVSEHNAHGELVKLVEEYRKIQSNWDKRAKVRARVRGEPCPYPVESERIDAALSAARGE